jgi:acyl-CoA synthetase (AMP-forming)/AMP-acid ligase II
MLAGDILTGTHGHKPAIVFTDQTFSYEELDSLSNRLANLYLSLGLTYGDRVSILFGSDPLAIGAYFGAFRAGLIANPLNNRLTPRELAYILNHAEPACIIVSGEFAEKLSATLPQLRSSPPILLLRPEAHSTLRALGAAELKSQSPARPEQCRPAPEHGALLLYTSGTTGHPKGVLLSHANIVAGVSLIHDAFEIKNSDRTLCVMPIFHTNGLMFSVLSFLMGGAAVMLRPRFSATALWDQIRDCAPNSFSVSPTILAMMLEHEARAPAASDIKLDYIKVASAPTSLELATRFEARFGTGLLLETFGLTETTAINTMNPLHGRRKFGSIGQALAPQELRIVDDEGRQLGSGQTGELIIRGPTVMKEYFRDPENTKTTIRDGWLHTGDVGKADGDGFFYIVGRKKEMILRGGENISPLEIDGIVASHPRVLEAASVGLPDPIWGEVVGLCVVRDGPLNEEDIQAYCRANLSAYKVPQHIRFIEALPRNAMGKVLRAKLREVF